MILHYLKKDTLRCRHGCAFRDALRAIESRKDYSLVLVLSAKLFFLKFIP